MKLQKVSSRRENLKIFILLEISLGRIKAKHSRLRLTPVTAVNFLFKNEELRFRLRLRLGLG